MGEFQERIDSIKGFLIAKLLLFEWLLEFARDYSENGDEATQRWFG